MFYWREQQQPTAREFGVDWGFTDRHGGVSEGQYASLNLGAGVDDDPASVAENRSRLASGLGLGPERLQFMSQQHGCDVHLVQHDQTGRPTPEVDGLIARGSDIGLAALVADCTPVLLVDRTEGLAAAVHAGRPGMMAGVVPTTIARMRELGAANLVALVGPSICGRCYEVPADLRQGAAQTSAVAATMSWTGTPAIDVAAAVVDQLAGENVPVTWVGGCARETEDLFSYRGEGKTGRFAGFVRLLPPEEELKDE